ncbi:MAG: serine hydrolase [Bacteroidetes bacterium]|nr:serine hydrolase [Bacteroidota bacterium]
MNHKRYMQVTVIMLMVFVTLGAQAQPAKTKAMTSEFDKLLSAQFKAGETGCAALVAVKGEIIYKKAFGMADLELNVPMQPDMIFRVGSITKQFTAIAILQLMEQGKLSLQDDITKFIPDYPTQAYKITIEHLLTHTSGIKSYTNVPEFENYMKEDLKPDAAIDKFKNLPMDFAPGTKWLYNNSGYFLLGYIIEKASGKTYAEYIEENLFKPAGMTSSIYGSDKSIVKNRASGYQPEGDKTVNADYLSMLLPYSAGSIMSTVEDLYRWNRALISYKLVKKETLEKAFTEYKLSDGKGTSYGYGWFLHQLQGSPTIEHGGAINGFLCNGIYLPAEDMFVAVFSNSTAKSPDLVSMKIAAVALGKPLNYKAIPVAADVLDQYTGIYEDESGSQRLITRDSSQLFSQRSGGQKYKIYPMAADKFFLDDSFTTITFNRNESGNIKEAVLDDRGTLKTWTRSAKPLPTHIEIKLSPDILSRYVGNYELVPGFILAITVEGDRIFSQATGQGKIEIYPETETKFFLKVVDATLDFSKDDAGNYSKVTLHQGKVVMEGKRK